MLQVVDTVALYRLPHQRKLRLRFLASYVLREDIQQTTHDSIEDARAAVLLLHEARRLQAAGTFKQKLQVPCSVWAINCRWCDWLRMWVGALETAPTVVCRRSTRSAKCMLVGAASTGTTGCLSRSKPDCSGSISMQGHATALPRTAAQKASCCPVQGLG